MPPYLSAAYSAAKIHPPYNAAISPLKNDNSPELLRQKDYLLHISGAAGGL
jgi:hypothetical protein